MKHESISFQLKHRHMTGSGRTHQWPKAEIIVTEYTGQ